jgi:hypothetical protein
MDPNSNQTTDQTADSSTNERRTNRVAVADAAQLLGLSAEAVRMRIKRGTLASEKVAGTVYVLLDADLTRSNQDSLTNHPPDQLSNLTTDQTGLVEALRSEVEFLREELSRREEVHVEESRRKDSIIAALTQRIPELEAPREHASEPQESPTTPAEPRSDTAVPHESADGQIKQSWWRRFFGL